MSNFYFLLWVQWFFGITFYSIVGASILSFIITLVLYINHGMQNLNSELLLALYEVFKFWLMIFWNITLLIALFRSLKYIFNKCLNGYKFTLLSCSSKLKIEFISYGDLVKVWRKWLMLIIWIVAIEMIIALTITKLFSSFNSIFDWFSIYLLYIFILIAGYFSFMILPVRCSKVRVQKC